jgi:nucleotide-binding universal stress UspA family protein
VEEGSVSTAFPKTVIATVEPKPTIVRTLEAASRIAQAFGAKLRIVHVLDSVTPILAALLGPARVQKAEQKEREAVEQILAAAATAIGFTAVPPLETLRGDTAEVLIGLASPENLLVVGVRGGGFQSHGSTVRRVVRGAAGDVLCIQERSTPGHAHKNILVALEATEASKHALGLAHELAAREKAKLEAIHVYEGATRGLLDLLGDDAVTAGVAEKLEARARERLKDVLASVSPAPPLTLLDGYHPARRIAPFAQLGRHDLIVMGARFDRERKDMVLGTVADELMALATQDVLVVKTEV